MLPSTRTFLLVLLVSCVARTSPSAMDQNTLSNERVRTYAFLVRMAGDDYFPDHLVEKSRGILVELCHTIERAKPNDLEGLYTHTHRATEAFNALQAEFEAADSELETVARENIGADIAFIAEAYGYDADVEELIAPREW
jgi:hypothetical protein